MSFPDYHDERPAPRKRAESHPYRWPLLLLAAILGVGLGAAGYWGGKFLFNRLQPQPPLTNPDAQPREAVANGPLDAEENEAHELFERVKNSVVSVNLVHQRRGGRFDLSAEEATGAGSGFIWDADGRIVTNFHVVEEAANRPDMAIKVVLADPSKKYDAAIVGLAPEYDLAVIQVEPRETLRPIELGTSADLKVGQKVFAIGNPFELPGTMTKGIISALNRPTKAPSGGVITGCIQHTAPINPGNSGGPLLNRFGHLIGVNSSIITPSGGNVGIGFAIPADTVNQVVTEIKRTGRALKPDLGIRLYDQQRVRRAGYPRGVMIAEVVSGGPAAAAGLRGIRPSQAAPGRAEPGDLITAIHGEEIANMNDYQRVVSSLKPGQRVTLRYLRDDEEHEATLTVRGA
jgi:S1-C subfamily serine protease